jgi:hypothetical protein
MRLEFSGLRLQKAAQRKLAEFVLIFPPVRLGAELAAPAQTFEQRNGLPALQTPHTLE